MPETHVVVEESPEGLTLFSPQLPGFTFARSTREALLRDYQEALWVEGIRGAVVGHWQKRLETSSGREAVLRWSSDHTLDVEARLEVANRLQRLLVVDDEILLGQTPNDLGEYVFVCCIPSDTVDWVVRQLDPRGDVVSVAVAVADQMVGFVLELATSGTTDWPSVESQGITADTTMSEVLRAGDRGSAAGHGLALSV